MESYDPGSVSVSINVKIQDSSSSRPPTLLPVVWEVQNASWYMMKISYLDSSPSLLQLFCFVLFCFWSEPKSETIRDWIILAAGLCFHIHPPWKGLITI